MNKLNEEALKQWLRDRPQTVIDAALKYPPGTAFKIHNKIMYVVAYSNDGSLHVSEISVLDNYLKAVDTRVPICKCCTDKLEELKVV